MKKSELTESIRKNLDELKKEKFKKFLKDEYGIDFDNKIKMITSTYDIPSIYLTYYNRSSFNTMLNYTGPFFLFKFKGVSYLYQSRERSSGDWAMDDSGEVYFGDDLIERLGLSELGLRFSDIMDLYKLYEE